MRGSLIGAIASTKQSSINFASLLSSAYQSVQTDKGLIFGTTPKAKAGNTATTVLTLSGAAPSLPVPIKVRATNSLAVGSGGAFNIYYDGGTTPAMTGVVPTAATPVALTGAAAGQSLAWVAGTVVTGNEWDATCSGWTDQSGNGNSYAQATASLQPLVSVGLNGKPGLLFDGVDDFLECTSLNMPNPAVTAWALCTVFRSVSWSANARILDSSAGDCGLVWMHPSTPSIEIFNGAVCGASVGPAVGTWGAFDAKFSASAGDYLKAGSGAQLGFTTAGAGAGTGGRRIGAGASGQPCANVEVLQVAYMPVQSVAAYRAAVTALYGGSAQV